MRTEKSVTGGGNGLQERGGGAVTNVLWWSSRYQHNSHSVGVTGTGAPASDNNGHITRLEEFAVLACGKRKDGEKKDFSFSVIFYINPPHLLAFSRPLGCEKSFYLRIISTQQNQEEWQALKPILHSGKTVSSDASWPKNTFFPQPPNQNWSKSHIIEYSQ